MAGRIRTIKPEFLDSPDTAKASIWARYAYIGMWMWADDTGRGTLNVKELDGFIFPNDDLSKHGLTFSGILRELPGAFGIVFYEVEGRKYFEISNWNRHQRCYEKRGSKYPGPDHPKARILNENLAFPELPGTSGKLPENPAWNRGTGEQGNSSNTPLEVPPTATANEHEPTPDSAPHSDAPPTKKKPTPKATRLPDDWQPSEALQAWTHENFPHLPWTEYDRFRDYWLAADGPKARKRDWDATWRNWARRANETTQTQRGYRNQSQMLADMRAEAAQATTHGSITRLLESPHT